MERTDNTSANDPGQGATPRVWSSRDRTKTLSPASHSADEMPGAASQEVGVFNHIPVFLDRTFRMIEEVPDDVVCWSTAGDSFIIKQVLVFEEVLPSYFNHKKFMSFVRQLNFYGFKKTKGGTSSCSRSADHGACGDGTGAGAATKESESWEEFRHPHFRRGRRDLLVCIKRQKDGGRLKRKRADAQKSDIVGTLATDVEALSGDLKAVKGKLDGIMSLLLNMAGGQNQAAPSDPVPRSRSNVTGDDAAAAAAAAGEGGGRDGGGARFGGGAQIGHPASFNTAEPPAATARGGYGQKWLVGWGNGGILRGGRDPCAHGAVFDYRTTPRDPVDHPQNEWQRHLLHSRLPQQPYDAGRYPGVPSQHHTVQPQPLPSLPAAVETRGSSSASTVPSRPRLPPLHFTPPRPPESATSSRSECKEGGEGKHTNLPKISPSRRGDGDGGGVVSSPSSSSANADPHDARQHQHQRRRRRCRPQEPSTRPTQAAHSNNSSRETAKVVVGSPARGGWRGVVDGQTQQGSSDGTRSTLRVVAETDKMKRANSINSTGSTGSINSSNSRSTQSSYECE